MKKLLILLALCMVCSLVMVACTEDPATDPETEAQSTEAPSETEAETKTETETETEPETEADSGATETEPETTTSETEPETEPEPVKVVAGMSFDAMANVYGGEIDMESLFFSSHPEYLEWNHTAEINHLVDSVKVLGWVAFFTETEGVLGYSIDGAATVYPEGFSTPAEQDVLDHIAAGNVPGGVSAARMFSDIPVRALSAGEHTVALYAKDAAGNEEVFAEFKLVKVDNSLKVDLNATTVTGTYSTVYTGANATFNTTPAVGADEYLITLHYGTIHLGELDLSQYSKVTVTYGTAADGLIPDSNFSGEYAATQQRVLLLNAASATDATGVFELLPEDNAIVASAHYEISDSFMSVKTVEIDLSEVDHNGQLYLSFDFRNEANELGAIGYLISVIDIVFE